MQEFTYYDMAIIGITLVLGLKGFFRGFIQEALGLIGIIGGIFIASRYSLDIGTLIKPILALENEATIKLIGFSIGLIGFWIIAYFIGLILTKVSNLSGLGIVNRILGFSFGSAKIFLIFSVIIYALYQVKSFKPLIEKTIGTSITFPYLVDVGGYIIKIDTTEVTKNIEKSVDSVVNTTKKTFSETIEEKIEESTKEVLEGIQDTKVEETTKSTKEVLENIQDTKVEETIKSTLQEK